MADARIRELERKGRLGDIDAQIALVHLRGVDCGHGASRVLEGAVIFYCSDCGWDSIVAGVLSTFLSKDLEEYAREYMNSQSLWMDLTGDQPTRGGGGG
jgi:hypothetical protein